MLALLSLVSVAYDTANQLFDSVNEPVLFAVTNSDTVPKARGVKLSSGPRRIRVEY